MHLFGHNLDHDYYFELPCEGERDTQSIIRCSTAHHRLFRAVPRANRILSTARNPTSPPTCYTDNGWFLTTPHCGHPVYQPAAKHRSLSPVCVSNLLEEIGRAH